MIPIDLGNEERQIKDYYNLVIENCHWSKIDEVMKARSKELEELRRKQRDR